jgi:hypothetical protein
LLSQQGMAGRSERREVRHGATGREPEAGFWSETEQVDQPDSDCFLDRCRSRGSDEAECVLIPYRREPVGGDRGRKGAADHEAEIAGSSCGDQAPLNSLAQVLNDLLWLFTFDRQPASDR